MIADANELVNIGKKHFEKKEYHKAENYLRQALEKGVKYADVYNMLGVIDHIEGKFDIAIDMFKKALKINSGYTEAIINLAVLYNDLGHYEDAKKLYTKLSQSHKGKKHKIEPVLKGKLSNLHANIGDIYRSLGLYDHAIEEYVKALSLNPTYVDIRTKLGISYRENDELQKSLSELKKVTKGDSSYITARIQLGVTYYSMGKLTEAKKQWNTALKKDPKNEYAQMYLRLAESARKKK
jgi:tetratricopeptide (TPR) repeat protein